VSRLTKTMARRTAAAFLALLALAAILVPAAAPRAAASEFYVVIVNEENPLSVLPASEVSRIFLKRSDRWPNGELILPIDLPVGSPVRESFSKEIHDRSTAAIRAYWQQLIFSGRGLPPPEKGSGADIVEYVRSHRGGIGYVSVRTSLGAGVKVLKVTH
jgi:ABC-type phosphate transport system substrate-binding protein